MAALNLAAFGGAGWLVADQLFGHTDQHLALWWLAVTVLWIAMQLARDLGQHEQTTPQKLADGADRSQDDGHA